VNYGGGSVMVWDAISVQGRIELVSLCGARMTAVRYITDIYLHPINEIIISSYLPLPIVLFVTSTYYKVLHTFSLPKLTFLHP
jgi:hypothetical protein